MGYIVCFIFWGGSLVYISGKGSEKCQVEIIRENIVSSKGSRLDCNNLFPVPHGKKNIVPIYNYYQKNVPYIQYDKHIIWNTAYYINKSSCKVVLDCYVPSRREAAD